ncbi:MAG: nuclear transport factor 2 family protein [Proteobacteria bacterium]|nr:nuclear transport factor 2 family protein [Pseudomonadota bacterium]
MIALLLAWTVTAAEPSAAPPKGATAVPQASPPSSAAAVAPASPSGGAVTASPAALPASAAAAHAAAAPDSPALRAFKRAIRAQYDLKERAFAAHDAQTIVTKFYSSDVISVGEGEGIFVGRDAIRPLYQEVVKDNHVKIDSVYTFVDGNAGWDWADFHVMPAKDKPFTFAILFLWAKVGGQWICKGDFFMKGSFRAPPAQAPASTTK